MCYYTGNQHNFFHYRYLYLCIVLCKRYTLALITFTHFIIRLKARLQPNIGNTRARFDGVHAFGYNSAKSELIWMKSGAL